MLLTILAIIGKRQDLPRERWKLYEHAAAVLLLHWDVNKRLRDARVSADFIDEDDKRELLSRIARRMQVGAGKLAGNHLLASDLVTVQGGAGAGIQGSPWNSRRRAASGLMP